jgi:hypothetical protein
VRGVSIFPSEISSSLALLPLAAKVSGLAGRIFKVLTKPQRLSYRPESVPARLSAVHHGLGRRRSLAVLVLGCLLTPARLHAEEHSVTVACPELDREDAAEFETRARAALLTSALDARITIACDAGGVLVTAQSADESASVRVTPTSATFRDEVLAAVDAALERLRPPKPANLPPSSPDVDEAALPSMAPPASAPPPAPPVSLGSPAATPTPTPTPPLQRSRFHAEIFGAAGVEAWSERLAGTARVGARYGGRRMRLGLRGGAARLLVQDASFSATELSVTVHADLELAFAGGARLALDVGPSLLVVTPADDVSALGNVTAAALLVGAELSRPVWLGRMAVVPALGVRWCGGTRGVTLDRNERFVLSGFSPNVTLGMLYRLE